MDDPAPVCVVHTLAGLPQERDAGGHAQSLALREAHDVERTLDQLQRNERHRTPIDGQGPRIVDLGDRSVLQRPEHLDLEPKPAALRRGAERVREGLHRDCPTRRPLPGAVHDSHAASPKDTFERITSNLPARQVLCGVVLEVRESWLVQRVSRARFFREELLQLSAQRHVPGGLAQDKGLALARIEVLRSIEQRA